MGCLNDIAQELKAGQIAGKLLTENSPTSFVAQMSKVPPTLRTRVKEIIDSYEKKEICDIADRIISLKTRLARNGALTAVRWTIRARVRKRVEDMWFSGVVAAKRKASNH